MMNVRLADVTGFAHAERLQEVPVPRARFSDHVTGVAIAGKGMGGVAAAVVDISIIIAHTWSWEGGLVVMSGGDGGWWTRVVVIVVGGEWW